MALAALLLSCAAPSRLLTPRVVEDSIVLPRRMASISAGAFVRWNHTVDTRSSDILPSFRLGVTDRLQWSNLTFLSYAFLDDAPSATKPAPLSLALTIGAPFGFSSIDGFVISPSVSLEALKHVSNLWRFWVSASTFGQWLASPTKGDQTFSDFLLPKHRSWAGLNIDGGAQRQLVERVALALSGGVEQLQDCFGVVCQGTVQGGNVSASLSWRPINWLTVSSFSTLNGRYRYYPPGPAAQNAGDPPSTPLRSVRWTSVGASATFYW